MPRAHPDPPPLSSPEWFSSTTGCFPKRVDFGSSIFWRLWARWGDLGRQAGGGVLFESIIFASQIRGLI